MLQERIRRQQQATQLEQTIAAMPEYPIYRVSPGRYVVYVAGQRYLFDTEVAARMRQLAARAEWLRATEREEKAVGR
jgi:hypothetical protein